MDSQYEALPRDTAATIRSLPSLRDVSAETLVLGGVDSDFLQMIYSIVANPGHAAAVQLLPQLLHALAHCAESTTAAPDSALLAAEAMGLMAQAAPAQLLQTFVQHACPSAQHCWLAVMLHAADVGSSPDLVYGIRPWVLTILEAVTAPNLPDAPRTSLLQAMAAQPGSMQLLVKILQESFVGAAFGGAYMVPPGGIQGAVMSHVDCLGAGRLLQRLSEVAEGQAAVALQPHLPALLNMMCSRTQSRDTSGLIAQVLLDTTSTPAGQEALAHCDIKPLVFILSDSILSINPAVAWPAAVLLARLAFGPTPSGLQALLPHLVELQVVQDKAATYLQAREGLGAQYENATDHLKREVKQLMDKTVLRIGVAHAL